MKKYKLSLSEEITYILIYAMLPVLVFSIIQAIATGNRLYWSWLILIGIFAAMNLIGGIGLVTVMGRFQKREEAVFIRFRTYMIKNGIIAVGNYLSHYAVFDLNHNGKIIRTESIGPVKAREVSEGFKEGKVCQIWVNEKRPWQCCTDPAPLISLGIIQLALAAGLIVVILLLA
ncbi:MAG: hypothetical protein ACOYBC_05185 [Bilifractor sp.]|jgi:hypothetical protein